MNIYQSVTYKLTEKGIVSAQQLKTAQYFQSIDFNVEDTSKLAGEIAELFQNKAIKTVKHSAKTLAMKQKMADLFADSVNDNRTWSMSF